MAERDYQVSFGENASREAIGVQVTRPPDNMSKRKAMPQDAASESLFLGDV
jgi:hypothetical protein